MSLPNRWHLRRVADTSSRACYICYKPTTSVLITADNKDYFYVCNGHLTDKGFCSPIVNQDAVQRASQEAREREIERVKVEWEEKQRKKEEKAKAKEKEKEKEKEAADKDDEDKHEKEERDSKKSPKAAEEREKEEAEDQPRIFALHKTFQQMRIDRLRNAEMAKRNWERLKNPSTFPEIPSGDL